MIMAEMAAFDNLKALTEMAENLATFVRQAAVEGAAAHEVEKGVWQRVLAMGRQATGQFFQMQGDGDVGETIEMPDGEKLRRLPEPHRRTYRSIFGPFTLWRYVYGTREGQRIDFVPLDARLKLPESELSYVLQDWAGTLCVEHAFSRTAQTLDTILGLSLSVDSLERMSRTMAESVADFRDALKKPPVKEEGEILVTTADGKGIPMRRPADQRPVGARRKKGEKANKKQMATLGCVYTVDPKHRTAEDVVAALFRESTGKRHESPEPVARHKRVWSSLTYEQGDLHVGAETEVFTWMAREVDARRRDGQAMICLMDGQRMRYDEYLRAGYPIASGVIEGACRHVVKDRMERSGMRWTIDGAQAMLDLRSTTINDQWSAFQNHRIYPERQLLKQLYFQLAA